MSEPCLFDEPWVGQCKEPALGSARGASDEAIYAGLCCSKHSQEKCVVCGTQAFTRCQASIGVMCGRPLCDLCGKGEMCDQHSSRRGPVKLITELRARLDAEKARADAAEAGAAVLRDELLKDAAAFRRVKSEPDIDARLLEKWAKECEAAASGDAGRALLERLREAERQRDALVEVCKAALRLPRLSESIVEERSHACYNQAKRLQRERDKILANINTALEGREVPR
jgi:hypothetical protein